MATVHRDRQGLGFGVVGFGSGSGLELGCGLGAGLDCGSWLESVGAGVTRSAYAA